MQKSAVRERALHHGRSDAVVPPERQPLSCMYGSVLTNKIAKPKLMNLEAARCRVSGKAERLIMAGQGKLISPSVVVV